MTTREDNSLSSNDLRAGVPQEETVQKCVPGSHVRPNGLDQPCQCGQLRGDIYAAHAALRAEVASLRAERDRLQVSRDEAREQTRRVIAAVSPVDGRASGAGEQPEDPRAAEHEHLRAQLKELETQLVLANTLTATLRAEGQALLEKAIVALGTAVIQALADGIVRPKVLREVELYLRELEALLLISPPRRPAEPERS